MSAKGGSRQSRNPGLIQQPVCNLFAGLTKSRDVGEEIKRAMGFQTSDSWNRVQSIDENIAAPAELLFYCSSVNGSDYRGTVLRDTYKIKKRIYHAVENNS